MPLVSAEESCRLQGGDVAACLKQLDIDAAKVRQAMLICREMPEKTWVNQCVATCAVTLPPNKSVHECVLGVEVAYRQELEDHQYRTTLALSLALIAALALAAFAWSRRRRPALP